MPTTIVIDNLTEDEVKKCTPELETYLAGFKPAFGRREQFERFRMSLKGLLSDVVRKTIEGIALALGVNVRDLQHFAGQSPWPIEPLVALHQQLTV